MKGYKVTDPNYKCKGMLFEVGKTYEVNGELKLCSNGIHFCCIASKCFDYYDFDIKNHVFEIEAIGDCIGNETDKICTNKINIIREIEWMEVLKIVNSGINNTGHSNSGDSNSGDRNSGYRNSGDSNSGHWNSGHRNSGDSNSGHRNSGDSNSGHSNSGDRNSGHRNSGDRNSGYRNSGDRNSGYLNSGDWNSGHRNSGDSNSGDSNSGHSNSGDRNSGHRNSGDRNSGHRNSGDWNSGDWNSGYLNSGDWNSGIFCIKTHKIKIFDIDSDMTMYEFNNSKYFNALFSENLPLNTWRNTHDMTVDEIKNNPNADKVGGYLKTLPYKKACAIWWSKLTEENKEIIQSMPNFNKDKFFQITGIKL